ncbi:MAG: hypothetical protein ACRDP6_44495, partial [Actinoallomurus sp.]
MDLDLVAKADGRAVALTVEADERATVGDLRRALAELVGRAGAPIAVHAESAGARPTSLGDETPLSDAGLTTGATIAVGDDDDDGDDDDGARNATVRVQGVGRDAGLEAAVVGGLHAGIVRPLSPGDTVAVGRAARGGLLLPDPE